MQVCRAKVSSWQTEDLVHRANEQLEQAERTATVTVREVPLVQLVQVSRYGNVGYYFVTEGLGEPPKP